MFGFGSGDFCLCWVVFVVGLVCMDGLFDELVYFCCVEGFIVLGIVGYVIVDGLVGLIGEFVYCVL